MSDLRRDPALRIAVITMVQAGGLPHSAATFESVATQLTERRHHLVHVNDRRDVQRELPDHPWRFFESSHRNLGVAGGRNALLRRVVSDYDLVVSIDDDLLLPSDYLDQVERVWAEAFAALGDRVGFICPTVLDYHATRNVFFTDAETRLLERGSSVRPRPTQEFQNVLRRRFGEVPASAVFHMGARHWKFTYLGISPDHGVESPPMVADDPLARAAIVRTESELCPVDTVPGGVAVYSTAMIGSIGFTDEAFGPFGFEDSEHSIRALKAGYVNLTAPSLLLIHDFQGRRVRRDDASTAETRGRMVALLQRLHGSSSDVASSILNGLLARFVALLPTHSEAASFSAWQPALRYLCGIGSGLVRACGHQNDRSVQSSWSSEGCRAESAVSIASAADQGTIEGIRYESMHATFGQGVARLHLTQVGPVGGPAEFDITTCGFEASTNEISLCLVRQGVELLIRAHLGESTGDRARFWPRSVMVERRGDGQVLCPVSTPVVGRLWTWMDNATSSSQVIRAETPRAFAHTHRSVDVVFAPHNRYHVVEMGQIFAEAEKLGLRCLFIDVEDAYQDEGVRKQLAASELPSVRYQPSLLPSLGCSALFVMNDWGGPQQLLMDEIKSIGGETVALVEGVQDFNDDYFKLTGFGRLRSPYRHADWVFATGCDDLHYLDRSGVIVTGAPRFEHLFSLERPSILDRVALVNVNFTYGVYENERDNFVSATSSALASAKIDAIYSKHHADKRELHGVTVSDRTLYDDFENVGVVISRFSGVILEAMARGIPTIYFNPFSEVIPKFTRDGAVLFSATSEAELVEQLQTVFDDHLATIRERQDRVLRRHLSITDVPSARRAAIELESIVAAVIRR